MCLYGGMVRVRVFASFVHVWHMCGYLQWRFDLARVRTDVFCNQVSIGKRRPWILMNIMIAPPFSLTPFRSMLLISCRPHTFPIQLLQCRHPHLQRGHLIVLDYDSDKVCPFMYLGSEQCSCTGGEAREVDITSTVLNSYSILKLLHNTSNAWLHSHLTQHLAKTHFDKSPFKKSTHTGEEFAPILVAW